MLRGVVGTDIAAHGVTNQMELLHTQGLHQRMQARALRRYAVVACGVAGAVTKARQIGNDDVVIGSEVARKTGPVARMPCNMTMAGPCPPSR